MSNGLLAQIAGGGSQIAPTYQTYDPSQAETSYLAQNFAGAQTASNNLTAGTSAANLATNLTGLNQVDAGALTGINAEQNLGNTLLSGSGSALPAWAQNYMNKAQQQGAESAIGRGVGAFSGNGQSGVNQYVGNNAMSLVNMGAAMSTGASGQAQGLVNQNMYRSDPMNGLLNAGQITQLGEFNTGILNQQADANAAVTNYNNNNSPLGSALRTTAQVFAQMGESFLGSMGSMMRGGGGGGGSSGGQGGTNNSDYYAAYNA